jgi:FixJ family two-component response regulator
MAPGETVLVVDDDAAVRSALKFALEVEGFDVRVYADSAAVLAERALPSRACLIIDYRMPGMDGLELAEVLHARRVDLPIILISGRVNPQLRQRARKSGVTRVLEKPLSDATLVENIRDALAGRP